MQRKLISLLMLVVVSLLYTTGCSPKFNVLVGGKTSLDFEQSQNHDKKYKIFFDNERNKKDLDYHIVYNGVADTFRNNRFHLVENPYDADYIVSVNFSVSGPHGYTVDHSIPITGQVGVNTHRVYSYGQNGMIPYTYTTPKYGTIGYNHYQTTEKFYTHGLSVVAYGLSKPKLEITHIIWEITAVTSNETNDFRKILPALLLVLEKHMAKDTHGNINIELHEKDGKLIEKDDMFKTNN